MLVQLWPHRFPGEDYHRMAKVGILGEDDRVEHSETQPDIASAKKIHPLTSTITTFSWIRRESYEINGTLIIIHMTGMPWFHIFPLTGRVTAYGGWSSQGIR